MSEKAIVYAEDMTDEMMNEAIKTAKNAFQSSSNRVSGGPYKETAAMIRSHFDKHYGPHWNCIVGRRSGGHAASSGGDMDQRASRSWRVGRCRRAREPRFALPRIDRARAICLAAARAPQGFRSAGIQLAALARRVHAAGRLK